MISLKVKLASAVHWFWDRNHKHFVETKKVLRTEIALLRDLLKNSTQAAFASENRAKWYRAQLMQIRVNQATEYGRRGWEVLAYLPNSVVDFYQHASPLTQKDFSDRLAYYLVDHAMKGIINVHSNGQVNALIFEPVSLQQPAKDPRWIKVFFENGNIATITRSDAEKLPTYSDEQWVNKCSGLR